MVRVKLVYSSTQAAITKYHRLVSLCNKNVLLTVLKVGSPDEVQDQGIQGFSSW